MRTISISEFYKARDAQGVPVGFGVVICPGCKTPQNAQDLIKAGAGASLRDVAKFLGVSCVGRFTGAPAPRREPDGNPCNWTLGGLLKIHTTTVVDEIGRKQPFFDIASPEVAQAHVAKQRAQIQKGQP
jgi:hypothetical protein